ncbi:MAG: C40 family peptidase [Oscillospiraceae bacterium]|nr:C40 family peptidase [Oscillospiraceae bacterium]
MNILKKLITSIILIIIVASTIFSGSFSTTVNAASATGSLNDGQRQGLVDGIVKIINAGNTGANLRYCQYNRLSGFNNLTPVNSGKNQQTVGTLELDSKYYAQLQALINQKYSDNKTKYVLTSPQKYTCTVLGADITGKIAFDCSSLVDAAYKFAVGTSFTWASTQLGQDSSYFKAIPMSAIKPGDILWHPGHVGIYLGDVDNDGVAETAQAHGFLSVSKTGNPAGYMGASDALFSFLSTHLEYVNTTPLVPGHKSQPTVQLPASAIRDVKHQVDIASKFNASDWEKALTYVGPVNKGTTQDLTGLTTPTGGQDSTLQEYEKTGMYNAITVPNQNIVVWPKGRTNYS